MIIWFKPNDLVRSKLLFGASQMIWRAPIKYFQLKHIFWKYPLKSSVLKYSLADEIFIINKYCPH